MVRMPPVDLMFLWRFVFDKSNGCAGLSKCTEKVYFEYFFQFFYSFGYEPKYV